MKQPNKATAKKGQGHHELTKVAIACQGGGSHTAFTAGVLGGLLSSQRFAKGFRITALSGTSGGALCAGIAWSRLLRRPGAVRVPPPEERLRMGQAAAGALEAFWLDLACESTKPALDNPLWFPFQFPS